LICDDAPQFKSITALLVLCWVHEGRHYKKLRPCVALHQQQIDRFLTNFWAYYRQLLAYQEAPMQSEADRLSQAFDELVCNETSYDALDAQIKRTQSKKANLLLVLPSRNRTSQQLSGAGGQSASKET